MGTYKKSHEQGLRAVPWMKYLPVRGYHGGGAHRDPVPVQALRALFLSSLMLAWRMRGKGLARQHYYDLLRDAGWTGIWHDLPYQLLRKELDLRHPVLAFLYGQKALWYLILWRLAKDKLI